jgi:hypothetical protein
MNEVLGEKSAELQTEIDRLSERLGVRPIPVGFRTNDGLNIYVAEDVATNQAAKRVGDRAERFKYEYQVLSQFHIEWAKRNVRETAALFRDGQPEDIALLPDIGEPL